MKEVNLPICLRCVISNTLCKLIQLLSLKLNIYKFIIYIKNENAIIKYNK